MKPIIGIIMRNGKSESNRDIKYIYDDIINAVTKSGGSAIGITNYNFLDYIKICDGFILQGGSDIDFDDLFIISYLYKNDIPLFGICLGMQEMGYNFGDEIVNIDNHKNNELHEIVIIKNSLLYKILDCKKTLVNSRHKSVIRGNNLTVSARSYDNVIEAIEDKGKRFFLGLQWHPENMYNEDLNSRKIFDYFIKVCNDTKEE